MAEAKDQELEQQTKKRKKGMVEIEEVGHESSVLSDEDGEEVDRRGEVMETTGKKRKKRRKRETSAERKGAELHRDPLIVLGSDTMMMILRQLDARSVALSLLVSRGWHAVASSDLLWSIKCEELWLGKAHIPRSSQVRGLSKLAVYSFSVMDGKRKRITKYDLCDNAWEFHFNKNFPINTIYISSPQEVGIRFFAEAAPEYWQNLDPYWKGTGPPMRRYFHPDGSQTADPGDKVWGGHESCYTVVTSFVADGKIREHYVRINRWQKMSVLRKQDWSWEMSNSLYCYSSIPDADKEGGTGPLFPVF